jgi:AraC-like DNA-binding protein
MKNLIIIILLLITTMLFSQKKEHFVVPDSLKKMSFEVLMKKFEINRGDYLKREAYGKTYYTRSKQQKDIIIIANGMYIMVYAAKRNAVVSQYVDSIITITKNSNDFEYPAKAYILKSDFLMQEYNLKQGLYNILEAEKCAIKAGNKNQYLDIKIRIAVIKIELGKYEEALPLILENYQYAKTKKNETLNFNFASLELADIYIRLKKPDMALYYIEERVKNINPINIQYKYFVMYQGMCYALKKEYSKSNALLDKAIALVKPTADNMNLAEAYYYRGVNCLQNGNEIIKAKSYFVKVDSILQKTNKNALVFRNNYIRLIEITKELKQDKEQLYYLNRLMAIDEMLNKNNVVLSESINKNYDTPHLLSEKEAVISKINQEKTLYFSIGVVFLVALGFSLYYLAKTKREKKLFEERFHALMNQPKIESILDDVIIEDNKTRSFDLPKDIVKELMQKLIIFEKELGYLKLNLKLNDLVEQFDTNSSYLSKTINHYKGKNFSRYINDLRIDYVIKKLKADKKLRNYTIKAIAEEVGFNNSESFAKAFYNQTGLQPSYFVKKIEENKET